MKYFATKEQANIYSKENGGFVCKMENHDIYVVLPTDDNDYDEVSIIRRTFEVKKKDEEQKTSRLIPVWLLGESQTPSLFSVPDSIDGVDERKWSHFLAVLSLSIWSQDHKENRYCVLCNGLMPDVCINYYVTCTQDELKLCRCEDSKIVATVNKPPYTTEGYSPEVCLKPWITLCDALNNEIENHKANNERHADLMNLKKDIINALGAFWDNIKICLETEDINKTEMFDSIDDFAHKMKTGIKNITPKGQKTLF